MNDFNCVYSSLSMMFSNNFICFSFSPRKSHEQLMYARKISAWCFQWHDTFCFFFLNSSFFVAFDCKFSLIKKNILFRVTRSAKVMRWNGIFGFFSCRWNIYEVTYVCDLNSRIVRWQKQFTVLTNWNNKFQRHKSNLSQN